MIVSFFSVCAGPKLPRWLTRMTGVKVLCQVQYGARVNALRLHREKSYYDAVTKKKWRAAHFKIKIAMESPLLRFMVEYKGETVAYTEASYVDPALNVG